MAEPAGSPRHDPRRLFLIGGGTALLAVACALVQIGIEVVGVGLRGAPVPDTVAGWYSLLGEDRLLGFTALTGLQIPLFALLIAVFLALGARFRQQAPAESVVATAIALVGIAVYLASNTAFSMLTLADRYAAAEATERAALLAAGEAMLAVYEGPGLDAGVVLVMVATLVFAVLMARDRHFGRLTACVGLLAGGIGLLYYVLIAYPGTRILVLEAAAAALLLWLLLVAKGLLSLAGPNLRAE